MDLQEYIENPIKRHIIGLLMKNKKLKYSDLMPVDVDNVLFNYHLQHLVKNGLLEKDENYYSLSSKGLQATTNITDSGIYFPKFTPKYKLYLIENDTILLQHIQRTRWNGDITALSSKVVYGTGIEERANFRMKEKAGIEVHMKWVGTVRTRAFTKEKDLVDDSIYFVCYATEYEETVNEFEDNGELLKWYTFEEAIALENKNKESGEKTVEILERFQKKNFEPFVFEETITIT